MQSQHLEVQKQLVHRCVTTKVGTSTTQPLDHWLFTTGLSHWFPVMAADTLHLEISGLDGASFWLTLRDDCLASELVEQVAARLPRRTGAFSKGVADMEIEMDR